MSSEWVKMRLGDFIDLKRGYDLPKKSRSAGPIPLVSSAGVSDQHSEAKVRGPGVVTGRYGTIGDVFYIEEDFWPLNTTLYVRDFKGNDPRFTYYFLKTIDYLQYSDKAAVPGVNRNHLHMAEISVPKSVDEQRRIASVLSCLDDKIEANDTINQTLEQMAQAIFKSWFVDFEPVKAKIAALEAGGSEEDALLAAMQAISGKSEAELTRLQAERPEQYAKLRTTAELFPSAMQDSELGEIPEGWSVTRVNEIAEIVKGKSYKSAELEPSQTALVTLKSFNRGGGYRLDGLKEYTGKYKSQQEVMAGDLIIAYTDVTQAADVIGKPAMVIGDERYEHLVISLDVAVIRPVDSALKPYLYGLAKTDTFQYHTKAHTTGTTVLHLAKNAVPEYPLALPSKALIDAYAGQATPLFTLINEKVQESRSLESLRDTLLPKLLSGELSMPSTIDQLVAEPQRAEREVT